MVDLYAEYGVIGVIVILFAGMLTWFKGFIDKLVNNKMEDLENEIQQNRKIVVKLIDRWNQADERQDRRHEKVLEQLNDVTDELNFLKGRINGAGGRS